MIGGCRTLRPRCTLPSEGSLVCVVGMLVHALCTQAHCCVWLRKGMDCVLDRTCVFLCVLVALGGMQQA